MLHRLSKVFHSLSLLSINLSTRTNSPYKLSPIAPTLLFAMPSRSSQTSNDNSYYRTDGVRITHDPYAPGMAEKYGVPGKTDNEGFDPYRDTVGPGIYGGIVARDPYTGDVIIGAQYQNHNPRPGPVYAGGGYTPTTLALEDVEGRLVPLLEKFPDLANDVSTGGASPLHMCGMSQGKQGAVTTLVAYGADVESLDTYGMTPLHRMASNNLAAGASALIEAGADPEYKGQVGITPFEMARESRARDVMAVLKDTNNINKVYPKINIEYLSVTGAGMSSINGKYIKTSFKDIPQGFVDVCDAQGWDALRMWLRLNGKKDHYRHENNASYIYFNESDGKWWIDGPDGHGVYIVSGPKHAPPAHGWNIIDSDVEDNKLPMVQTFREMKN